MKFYGMRIGYSHWNKCNIKGNNNNNNNNNNINNNYSYLYTMMTIIFVQQPGSHEGTYSYSSL